MTAARTPTGRGGAGRGGPARPVGLRRSKRGQRCRRRLALRDSHIPLQGRAEAAALPPAPRTQASVPATPPVPGQTPPRPPSSGGSADPRPLGPQLGPALPASTGPRQDGVGTVPPSRAMGALWAPSSPRRPDRPRGPVEVGVGRADRALGAPGQCRGGSEGGGELGYCELWGAQERCCPPTPESSGQSLTSHNSCHLQEPRLDVKRMPQCPASRLDRPPSPVNVTVTHLRANSATVSWDVPEGNTVIGYSISQQRHNGPAQRVIREVNTTTRACALWGLAEDSDYTVQVRSIGLRGESPPGPRVHFRTLKGSDRLPSNSSGPAVTGLFCHHYDIIKDNDSNNNPKEKAKGPEQSPQGRPVGTRQKKSRSSNTIDV
ncbi:hypothetical protein P7K49_028674 [Saguinus oedipus]|uniref:Fibronectin type-III domain-containing protein n=1 Tax=Saguinus oedipus TaxID=9490 RepID=A0ABQ9U511_SAGOE|nr:hypothetical protein P7K49_028674 [Saguinus oedipus]